MSHPRSDGKRWFNAAGRSIIRHPTVEPKVSLCDSKIQGVGLCLTAAMEEGQDVLVELPLVIGVNLKDLIKTIEINPLGPELMKALNIPDIISLWRRSTTSMVYKCDRTFDLQILYVGLYKWLSYINHSCEPNVKLGTASIDGMMYLQALRPLAAEEELTISYLSIVDLDMEVQQRGDKVLQDWAFNCRCPRCRVTPLLCGP